MKLIQVVVYTQANYTESSSIYISEDMINDKRYVTSQVNKQFSKWFYYDIIC